MIPESPVMMFGNKPAVQAAGTRWGTATLDSLMSWAERNDRLDDDDKAAVRRAVQRMRNSPDDQIAAFVEQMRDALTGPVPLIETGERLGPPPADAERFAKPVASAERAGGPSGPIYDPGGNPNRYTNRNVDGNRNIEPLFNRTSSGAAGLGPAYTDRPRDLVERFDAKVTSEPLKTKRQETVPGFATADARRQFARAVESKHREASDREEANEFSAGPPVPDDVRKMADMARSMARASDSGYWSAAQLEAADRQRFAAESARRSVTYDEPPPLLASVPDDVRRAAEAARAAAVASGRVAPPRRYAREPAGTPYHGHARVHVCGAELCTCDGCRRGVACCG
jgi:hypothetical protein